MHEYQSYDELVDETTRYLFDGLLTGGGRELRSRVWGIMTARWKEIQAEQEQLKRSRKKAKKGKK